MKKIILLAIVAISFSITGCSDFLDTENLTKKDSSNYPPDRRGRTGIAKWSILRTLHLYEPFPPIPGRKHLI